MAAADDTKLDEILAQLQAMQARQNAPPKVWMSPEEAAEYLGVSRTRIYQYIRGDRIPFHRLPDSSLVRLNAIELDAWVKNSSQTVNEMAREKIRRLTK